MKKRKFVSKTLSNAQTRISESEKLIKKDFNRMKKAVASMSSKKDVSFMIKHAERFQSICKDFLSSCFDAYYAVNFKENDKVYLLREIEENYTDFSFSVSKEGRTIVLKLDFMDEEDAQELHLICEDLDIKNYKVFGTKTTPVYVEHTKD